MKKTKKKERWYVWICPYCGHKESRFGVPRKKKIKGKVR